MAPNSTLTGGTYLRCSHQAGDHGSLWCYRALVPLVTMANTGLFLGFDIAHAVESIKANPIGAEIGAST